MSVGKKIWFATVSIVLMTVLIVGLIVHFQLKTPETKSYLTIVYDTGNIKKSKVTALSSDDSREIAYTFDYNDEFFNGSSDQFNTDIAKFAVAMSKATYKKATAKSVLEELGYSNIVQYFYDDDGNSDPYYWKANSTDYDKIAFTLATKRVKFNDKTYSIYSCLIRGTQGAEWISDFDLGNPYDDTEEELALDGGDVEPSKDPVEHTHEGFKKSCENWVLPYFVKYVFGDEQYNLDSTIVWITGHSRGAAVANLLGKHLTDDKFYLDEEENVVVDNGEHPDARKVVEENKLFDYTIACPNVKLMLEEEASDSYAVWPERPKKYTAIYNITNPGDQVTCLPFATWGFSKYGTEIVLDTSAGVFEAMKTRFRVITGYNYNGATDCNKLVDSFTKWCPTYYDAAVTKDGKFDKTLLEVFKALGPIIGNEVTFESISNTIEKMGFALGETGGLGGKAFMSIAEYAFNGGLNVYAGGFSQAHSIECYYSWINSMFGGDNAVYTTDLVSFELIEDCITSVGTLAFYGNKYLSVVALGNSIERIDAFAFMGNQKLKSLIIPSSVKVIGDFAFALSGSLKEVYFDGDCPDVINSTVFQSGTTIFIHKNSKGWSDKIVDGKIFGLSFNYW